MANDCAQQRFAAMQATIDELRAKLQAREPIGSPWIGTPIAPIGGESDRISEKLKLAKQALEQAKRDGLSGEWQKAAQPDLFPSHKPLRSEPHPQIPTVFYAPPDELKRWMDEGAALARGYVDPNRPDQAKAVSASIDGRQLSSAETRNLIDRLWANAQATQAQADRDSENLKK